MTVFPFEIVARHIRKKHPGCPEFAVEHIARLISEREWEGVKLGRAVGITMDGILRHQMTDYETLLLHGLDRKEARRRVQPKVNAMLKVWAKRPEAKPHAPDGAGKTADAVKNADTPTQTEASE